MIFYGQVVGIIMSAVTGLILVEAMVSAAIIQVVGMPTQGDVPVFMVEFPLVADMQVSVGATQLMAPITAAPIIAVAISTVVFMGPSGRHLSTPTLIHK